MNEKFEITRFTAGDTREHNGVIYKAVYQEPGELCRGCAFYKRGEPCKGPGGWLCTEIGETVNKDLIFKTIE